MSLHLTTLDVRFLNVLIVIYEHFSPSQLEQNNTFLQDFLYRTLQHLTLEYRIKKESTACRGWLSTGQEFALQEYAERYGIRYLTVHLSYLKELVNYAEVEIVWSFSVFSDIISSETLKSRFKPHTSRFI